MIFTSPRHGRPAARFVLSLAAAVLSLAAAVPALADIVAMTDGRVFEGEILENTPTHVTMDTMVGSTIRTTLRLERPDIESIEMKTLPTGFFAPPPAKPRVSKPDAFKPDQALYLEVPIKGRFGQEIWADSIAEIIRYAQRHRISDIVFTIDSDGGDIEEVRATYDLLRRNQKRIKYHALIKNCTGDALAVPLWCETLHIYPGAMLGGNQAELSDPADEADEAERQVVRAQVASEVIKQTGLETPGADIVRAMIDPAQKLAGWLNNTGEIEVDVMLPEEMPDDQVVFSVDVGELLVLDYDQATKLGLPGFEGTAADLGEAIGMAGWEEESDFARRSVAEMEVKKTQESAEATVAYNRAAEENIRRREIVDQHIKENMQLAAQWAPEKGKYDYRERRYGWSWRRGFGGSTTMTSGSRDQWRERANTGLQYIEQAAQAVTAMERLDREAVKLGLQPTYRPDEISMMKQKIQTQYDYYRDQRDRGTVSTSGARNR